VVVLGSKFCEEVLECLTGEGYIRGYSRLEKGNLKVFLKYKDGKSVIKKMSMVSRPGCRLYYSARDLRNSFYRNEFIVFSSSKGVFMNKALLLTQLNSGGEPLISIR
jgi:small subunit ribosomal protein S8